MAFNIKTLLNRASSGQGSTPYIARIHENLLERLVAMHQISEEYLMIDGALADDPAAYAQIEEERQELFDNIELIFGEGREYEDVARRAFEECDPESLNEAIRALVFYVVPMLRMDRDAWSQKAIPQMLEQNHISLSGRMGQNIRSELLRVFPDVRDTMYIKDFGSVFGLDVTPQDRKIFYRATLVRLRTAFEMGRDRDRLIEYKGPLPDGPNGP